MNKEQYSFQANPNQIDFEFESIGPNGKIKKLVQYRESQMDGIIYYNLAFGDLDLNTGMLNDRAISNNMDKEKVLATVAATVLEFTSNFPGFPIYVEGSTLSRTRLYQIAIAANLEDIDQYLEIYGLINDGWELFKKNINYQAFIAFRK